MATVNGLPELLNKFSELGRGGDRIAKAILNATADEIVVLAKQSAPADLGKIRQGIIKEQLSDYRVAIKATAPESAYQEFGTGGKVQVPAEMSEVASQFQGKGGGDMASFILALTDWVKRHGLTNTYSISTKKVATRGGDTADTQLAWAIAKKILREGLQPRPYLYPAYVAGSSKLMTRLETAFKELLKSRQASA